MKFMFMTYQINYMKNLSKNKLILEVTKCFTFNRIKLSINRRFSSYAQRMIFENIESK